MASKTALVMIEFQREFTDSGGKLHEAVKDSMASTNMLANAVKACEDARAKGCKIIHVPITLAKDLSDNPNKGIGILKGCADGALFQTGTWGAEFCDSMVPKQCDLVVQGKRGLDAFPGSDLEQLLVLNGIETVAIGGFLTDCCVDSTMRTACEMGFNVVTLTDCCAATSVEAHQAAVDTAFGMFSTPMKATDFVNSVSVGDMSPPEKKQKRQQSSNCNARTFSCSKAKGGCSMAAAKTALLMIEFQREFADEGGKLHDAVKDVMGSTGMLDNSAKLCQDARRKGCKVIHVPISLAQDGSDNPNKGLGILKGCADGQLFLAGSWNVEFTNKMTPQAGDLVVSGKKGLDAFPGTDLESLLVTHGIETVAIGGFLTNCCVESTMRTACEKGFNVVTLTDCCASTSLAGHKAAAEGTFGMFSVPMASGAFLEAIKA